MGCMVTVCRQPQTCQHSLSPDFTPRAVFLKDTLECLGNGEGHTPPWYSGISELPLLSECIFCHHIPCPVSGMSKLNLG